MSEEEKTDKVVEELLKKITDIDYEGEKSVKNPLHVSSLASATEQYLTPFITFGYDLNGDAVVVSNAQTQKDIDSIMVSIGRYLSQQQDGDIHGGIGDMIDDPEDLDI